MKLRKLKNFVLNTLFPQFCLNCQREGGVICNDCLSLIEVSEYVFCPFCKSPQRVFEKGACEKHQGKYLDGLFSAASYQQPLIQKVILKFKYPPYLKSLKPYLAYLIIAHFALGQNQLFQQNGENSLFIPMPLHRSKKRKRGFNQAELLTQELSKALKIPQDPNNLTKHKKTQSQTTLSSEQRAKNVKNAFLIKNPQLVEGKTIFLVDDVFTTGSTMEEAAKTLKKAGSAQVWGIAVAREPLG